MQSELATVTEPIARDTFLAHEGLTARDARILRLARALIAPGACELGVALGALRRAVEASIPAGRVFVLPTATGLVVAGSVLSRVGIAELDGVVRVVRVRGDGSVQPLAALGR